MALSNEIYAKGNKMVKEVCAYLNENNADFDEVYFTEMYDAPYMVVSIVNGDWYHSHIRIDRLMEIKGFAKMEERNVVDNDGDSFSSEHYYYIMSENFRK